MAKENWATKKDVEEIVVRVVGEVVGTATTEILNVVADRFEKVDADIADLRATTNRIENKLDPTIDRVDELTVRVNQFQAKAA